MRMGLIASAAWLSAASSTASAAENGSTAAIRGRRRLQTSVSYPQPASATSPALANPERGWYTQLTYRSSSPSRLDSGFLSNHRTSTGETLILRMVYLDSFVDGSPVGQGVLDDLQSDFDAMRAAGVKCILRFAYTDIQGSNPTEPDKASVLSHISQLSPVLAANQDAMLSVQAGFVGPWGEWHGSTNFQDDLEGRQEILSALLDAVPDRTVQVRTPAHKRALYGTGESAAALRSSGHALNGDFESGTSYWSNYSGGYTIETSDYHGGSASIKVTNGGARQWVSFGSDPVAEGYSVEVSGWSKRVGATGSLPWDYSIYADVAYSDGTYLWGQLAKFTGADTWNKAVHVITVPPGKSITGMSLYCMYRNAADGHALFDDVSVSVFEPPSSSGAEAVDGSNAFDGSHISRTGHHNDCFLASDTDYGTYSSPANSEEYAYLAQETRYTPMGGETCNPSPPRSECATALEEMELFHYTYLNSGYHQDVLGSWTSGGCTDEVSARLGYRLVLKTGSYGASAAPGGKVPYTIEMENEGYASMVNGRPFQLVLREAGGAICAATDASVDLRTWFGGEVHVAEGNLVLPADLPAGTYDLFLNLADESQCLRTDVNYKVKVANPGLNEVSTGLIDLQHSIVVAPGETSAPSNSGPDITVACGMEADVLPPVGPTGPVTNGGFEGCSAEGDWGSYMDGYALDGAFMHSGQQSIRVTNGGAKQWVSLNAAPGSQVTIRGWSKAVGTSTGLWDYGIYADVAYSDGTYLWGQIANFPGGTHDFTLGEKTFMVPAGKEVIGMSLYAMYRNDSAGGAAYFDDIEVTVD